MSIKNAPIVQTPDGYFRHVCHDAKLASTGFITSENMAKYSDSLLENAGATKLMQERYTSIFGPDSELSQRVGGDRSGVHATHCCPDHGCKYADDACPVVTQQIAPVNGCEECYRADLSLSAAMLKAVELGVMEDTPVMRSALQEIIEAANGGGEI